MHTLQTGGDTLVVSDAVLGKWFMRVFLS